MTKDRKFDYIFYGTMLVLLTWSIYASYLKAEEKQEMRDRIEELEQRVNNQQEVIDIHNHVLQQVQDRIN